MTDLLIQAEALHGDRTAISTHGTHLTYADLMARVRKLATVLRTQGVRPGDRVALLAANSYRYIEATFSCAMAGAVLVPLNSRLAPVEIEDILHRVEARFAFCGGDFSTHELPGLSWEDGVGPGGECPYETELNRAAQLVGTAAEDDRGALAQIFFTSGTTGIPKGVCLTQGNMLASAVDALERLDFVHDDVWLHSAPMFHLVDAFAIWGITLAGGCHVAAPFLPETFGEIVARERITKTSLPPTLLDWTSRRLSEYPRDVSSLRLISYGGSPMQEAVYARCRAALTCLLLQAYGLTEGSGFVCHEQPADNPTPMSVINSVGLPTRHVEVALRDENGAACPIGTVGELFIRGARVFREYWQDPASTAAAFEQGWYRTGDLGVRDAEGRFRIVGRRKEMIISGGENIYPAEVVNALLSHPAVAEAAVFGVPSERWGEEVRAVVYLAPNLPQSPSGDELGDHCRSLIGRYKAPKDIVISKDPLPKSGAGKIAVADMRAAYTGVRPV